MMGTYKKKIKKVSSEPTKQPGWTNQTRDLEYEIEMTP